MDVKKALDEADALADLYTIITTIFRVFGPKLKMLKPIIKSVFEKEGPKLSDALMQVADTVLSAKEVAARTMKDERALALCIEGLGDPLEQNFRDAWRLLNATERASFRELLITGPDEKLVIEGKTIVGSIASGKTTGECVNRFHDLLETKAMAAIDPIGAITHVISKKRDGDPGHLLSNLKKLADSWNQLGQDINTYVTAPSGSNADGPSLLDKAEQYQQRMFKKLKESQ